MQIVITPKLIFKICGVMFLLSGLAPAVIRWMQGQKFDGFLVLSGAVMWLILATVIGGNLVLIKRVGGPRDKDVSDHF